MSKKTLIPLISIAALLLVGGIIGVVSPFLNPSSERVAQSTQAQSTQSAQTSVGTSSPASSEEHTQSVAAAASVDVVEAASAANKPYYDPAIYGNYENPDLENYVKIPKLTLQTAAAQAFNNKIFEAYKSFYEKISSGEPYAYLTQISYEYAIEDGIVSILVRHGGGVLQGGGFIDYDVYYFDVNRDCELNLNEFLTAYHTSFAELTERVNTSAEFRDAGFAVSFDNSSPQQLSSDETAGFCITGVFIKDGILSVTFPDINYEGTCRLDLTW